MSGTLEAIWLKRGDGAPMDPVTTAIARDGSGLEGNLNQGGRRQVTLLSLEAWELVQEQLDLRLDPSVRRANLLISGIDLEASRGRVLVIGGAALLIRGETKPCNLMEKACPGLREALTPHWRGGAFGEVIRGGEVRLGDVVSWEDPS